MAIFKTTTVSKHSHLVYVFSETNPQTGEEVIKTASTASKGHSHEVIVDENGIISLLPSGKNGHTHEIKEALSYEEIDDDKDMTEDEKIEKYKDYIDSARELEKESKEKGDKAEKYYEGDQWDESVKQERLSQQRPAITINEIAPKIDLLQGFQRQNPTSIRFYPIESSDTKVSDLGTTLVSHVFGINQVNSTESEVFFDQLKVGRGAYNIFVDYDKNMFGHIVIDKMQWKDLSLGTHMKQNLEDCEYGVKHSVVTKKKLIQQYPDKKKEINDMFEDGANDLIKTNMSVTYQDDYDGTPKSKDIVDRKKELLRVNEIWEKQYVNISSIVDYETGYVESVNSLSKSDVKALEEIGLNVVNRTITQMKVITMCNGILLDERIEEQDYFPFCVAYAKRDHKGGFYGKVTEVIDCQDEINYRTSQSIDAVNRTSAYGFYYDAQTFTSPREEALFKRDVTSPGWTAKVRDLSKVPVQITGTKFPAELVNMQQLASDKMNLVMSISPEAMGFAQREVSSVAIQEQRRGVQQTQEYLFDNLGKAKKSLALMTLKLIQKTYSDDRIFRIVGNPNPRTEEEVRKNDELRETIRYFLEEEDLSTLDVTVELAKDAPSTRAANFAVLLEMQRNGAPIPPSVIIESSDLANKERILEILLGQQQAEANAAQEKNQTEITKTQIAAQARMQGKGGVPPQQM